jgi:hypothetical protein
MLSYIRYHHKSFCALLIEIFPIPQIFSQKYENWATFLISPFQFPVLLNLPQELFSFSVASHHFYPYFVKVYAKNFLKLASGMS